jgi:type 1 glutamine amidotransferase
VLTVSQQKAFEDYINNGGGFLGIHGAGGDFLYLWDWYADTLLGARFIGHPMEPQFQDADIHVEDHAGKIGADLRPGWTMKDEWYSFAANPRKSGAQVVATLDETTYSPEGRGGQNLRMGEDHPIVWTRCIGKGRSLYTAIGHRPEVYHIPENLVLLRDGLRWAAGQGESTCSAE